MKKIVKFIYTYIYKPGVDTIKSFFLINKILREKSYYPEKKRKNIFRRFFENFFWILKNHEINNFYNLYGFDVFNNNYKNYIPYRKFMYQRNKLNIPDIYNYIVLLRDKLLFDKMLKSSNIPSANTIGIIKSGEVYSQNWDKIDKKDELFKNTVYIKTIDGECADGVYRIESYDDYLVKKETFKRGFYIIQEKICQNSELSKIYSNSVNTIRIVTIRNGNNIEIFSAGLRVGTHKSKDVDNWAAGGLYIEIDMKGTLTKYGYAKPIYGGKFEKHPDTNICFYGYEIPFWKDVINIVKKAHIQFYGIHSIGWDVAITENGPVIIEGNDNWEISLMQANHGLKEKWYKCK